MDLQKKTLRLFKRAPRTLRLRQISEETGLQISWLSRFFNEQFDNPAPDKVQILHEYLASKPEPRSHKKNP